MPADRAALVDALRVCRRWIVEGQAQIGWSVDRIDEVLAAAALAAPPEAPDCRAAVRAALVRVCDMLEHMTRYRHEQAHNGDIFEGGDYETCSLCAPVRTAIADATAALAALDALAAPPEAMLVQHEYNLIAAAVGERGKTDCSTPLYVRVQNLVKQWDRVPTPDCRAAVRAALLEVREAIMGDDGCLTVAGAVAILDAKLAALERRP